MMIAAPALASTPRQILTEAAFQARDQPTALAQVAQSEAAANAILARIPNDREASVVRAMAIGYRAKLTRNRADALAARKLFTALVAADPRDPEAEAAIGAWHLDSVAALGGLVAGMVLGADKADGTAAMDRAVGLGGGRAMFPGLAALLRLALDPDDARARALAEEASRGSTVYPLDRLMQRSAAAVLVPLRAGDKRGAQNLAKQLLPFGRLPS
ncbi:hypothetical protein [Sphingomonas sp. YR710]|uniref:hypothetical protein n=1 Tax=Sphingomonas sp. YR710 TaxID=1882773 RepID=UPI0035246BE5